MLDLSFAGKTTLTVGGSSGIGNAVARAFRDAGARSIVWGTRAAAKDYAGEEGADLDGLEYSQVDVTDDDSIAAYVPPFDRLDVLVLSQGVILYDGQEFATANFQKVVNLNLVSLMACSEKFFTMLRVSRGSIVVVNSVAALHATLGQPAYNASKAGALGLTRTLGKTWAKEGVRVNGVAPGVVDTKMARYTTREPARLNAVMAKLPSGRMVKTDDVAAAVLFLASPLAAAIVGVTLPVDGGLHL